MRAALAIFLLPASSSLCTATASAKDKNSDKIASTWRETKQRLPLFVRFPSLAEKIAYMPLGLLPTPLDNCAALAQKLQTETLLIKRDDLSGELFGGNKVRKLEFLLSEACARGAEHVVTWGTPGSPHTTATAIYCHNLKLPCTCMYLPSPKLSVNEHNAQLTKAHQAIEETYRGFGHREQALYKKNKEFREQTGKSLYFIPEGGSDVLGALGFVNAVCELTEQLKAQQAPFPDYIYLLSGSSGSAAGFLAGLDLLHIKTTPVIVALAPDKYPHQQQDKIEKLYAEIMAYVMHLDLRIHTCKTPQNTVLYNHGFSRASDNQLQATAITTQDLCKKITSYSLDPIFSTRLWTAFLLDCNAELLQNKRVLLWNTGSLTTIKN